MGCGAATQKGSSNSGTEDVPDATPPTATPPITVAVAEPSKDDSADVSPTRKTSGRKSSNERTQADATPPRKSSVEKVEGVPLMVFPKRRASKPLTFIPEDSTGSLKLLDVVLVGGSAADVSRALCSSMSANESLRLRLEKDKDEKDSAVARENRCFCFSEGYVARVHFHPVTRFSDQLPTFPVAQLVSTACVVLPRVDCQDTLKSLERRVTEIRARIKMACAADPAAPDLLMMSLNVIGSEQKPQEEQLTVFEQWSKDLNLPVLARGDTLPIDAGDDLYRALAVEVTGKIFARTELLAKGGKG